MASGSTANTGKARPTTEIKFNSDEFYRLISDKPAIAKYLSAARSMIVVFGGVNYRIVE